MKVIYTPKELAELEWLTLRWIYKRIKKGTYAPVDIGKKKPRYLNQEMSNVFYSIYWYNRQ